MSVTYKEAMEQLSTMFPTIERSVINMILQQTRGHMERTIETLLELAQATEAPSKKTNGADDWGITAIKSTKSTTPTVREPKGSQKKQAESTRTNRRGSDGEKKDGSVLRDETESKVDDDSEVFVTMTSTEDFLRPPSYFQQQLLSRALLKEHEEAWAVLQSTLMAAGKHELVQYLVDEAAALKQAQLKQQEIAKQLREDAMLAELIQNEWLVEELARRGMGGPTRRNQPKRFIEMPQIRENYMIAAGGEGSSVEADVKGKGKERGNVMEQKDNRDGRNVDHDRNPETLSVPQQSMLDTFLSSFEGLGSAAREKVSKLIDKLSGSKELQKDPQGPGPKYIELSNFGDTIDDYDGGNNDGRSAGQDNRMLLVNDEDHTEVNINDHGYMYDASLESPHKGPDLESGKKAAAPQALSTKRETSSVRDSGTGDISTVSAVVNDDGDPRSLFHYAANGSARGASSASTASLPSSSLHGQPFLLEANPDDMNFFEGAVQRDKNRRSTPGYLASSLGSTLVENQQAGTGGTSVDGTAASGAASRAGGADSNKAQGEIDFEDYLNFQPVEL